MGGYDMILRQLRIGRWHVEFYFCPDGYDIDTLLLRMNDFGVPYGDMRKAEALMEKDELNTGFTMANPTERVAMVVVGPTENGAEFQNTLVHEVHHLAVAIAQGLGIDLTGEGPAYISGDSVRALTDVICELGCRNCHCSN